MKRRMARLFFLVAAPLLTLGQGALASGEDGDYCGWIQTSTTNAHLQGWTTTGINHGSYGGCHAGLYCCETYGFHFGMTRWAVCMSSTYASQQNRFCETRPITYMGSTSHTHINYDVFADQAQATRNHQLDQICQWVHDHWPIEGSLASSELDSALWNISHSAGYCPRFAVQALVTHCGIHDLGSPSHVVDAIVAYYTQHGLNEERLLTPSHPHAGPVHLPLQFPQGMGSGMRQLQIGNQVHEIIELENVAPAPIAGD